MRVKRNGTLKKAYSLPSRAVLLCFLLLLLAVVPAARPGQGAGQTQTPWTPQADGSPTGSLPGVAVEPSASKTQTSAPVQQPKPAAEYTGSDPKKKAISDDSTNLMKLANTLKAEMDKTSADTLSVTVMRKAGEIEQLARKMRSQ